MFMWFFFFSFFLNQCHLILLQKQEDDEADDELEIAIDNTAFMDEFFAEVRSGRRKVNLKTRPNL